VRQLSDSGNELFDNSNEPYVRLEWSHDLAQGELRELLAITHGCHAALASGVMLSHRKPLFQVRMILMEFVHGCHTAKKGCHTPPSRVKALLETPETQTRALPSLVRIRMVLMVTGIEPSLLKGDISDPLRLLTRHRCGKSGR